VRAGISVGGLSFCTVTGNTASDQGGGIYSTTADDDQGPAIRNTILAGNAAPAGPDLYANVQSRGANLVGATTGGTLDTTGGDNTSEGNLIGVDPRLGPLQDNGGPTWTRALLHEDVPSPAIDAGSATDLMGNAVRADQRGYPRPSPRCGRADIGAFEWQTEGYCMVLPLVLRQGP
jgi:parallel beta-helix repeat protein